MCLNNVDFALEWDKGTRQYVGYGYKKILNRLLPKYKRWQEATGDIDGCVTKPDLRKAISSSFSDGCKNYHPGFHIFLNKDDAVNYGSSYNKSVVKVKFYGVIAFGDNETYTQSKYGPCIITTHMKLVEVCKNG